MPFAENAPLSVAAASSLRRGRRSCKGPYGRCAVPRRTAARHHLRQLLIGDVETVAEKLVAEIHATKPVHVCFSFKVGNTPHAAAMRSMELMIGEVKRGRNGARALARVRGGVSSLRQGP